MTANLKVPKITRVKGLTLIELLIAMAISAILIAAIYRTFILQQKTYTVQEQVVDMQQNVRVAINKMMREIRMAGFGNVSNILPPQGQPFQAIVWLGKQTVTFNNIVNPSDNKDNIKQNDDQVTIIGAFEQVSTLAVDQSGGKNTIQLVEKASDFDLTYKKYICVGGLETHIITKRDPETNIITLNENLVNNYTAGTPVYKVKAITYQLRWDTQNPNMPVLTREDNTDGGGSQVVAENIENLQFRYTLDDGSEWDSPADPSKIRMVKVTVTARTSISDPEFKGGTGGYRRRVITSNILVRNVGLNP
jgi:prepilin-type N-terminal cleavage/methylation domain-containing protein